LGLKIFSVQVLLPLSANIQIMFATGMSVLLTSFSYTSSIMPVLNFSAYGPAFWV